MLLSWVNGSFAAMRRLNSWLWVHGSTCPHSNFLSCSSWSWTALTMTSKICLTEPFFFPTDFGQEVSRRCLHKMDWLKTIDIYLFSFWRWKVGKGVFGKATWFQKAQESSLPCLFLEDSAILHGLHPWLHPCVHPLSFYIPILFRALSKPLSCKD